MLDVIAVVVVRRAIFTLITCSGANLSIYAQMMVLDMLYLELLQISREEVEKSLSLSRDTITRHDSLQKPNNDTKDKV